MAAGPGERSSPIAVTWEVRFTALADGDVSEAYAWYEAARDGLGDDFLADLGRALDFVRTHPEGCPIAHRDLRRALLHRFPYSLHYCAISAIQIIEVRACLHQRRHPRTWRRRA
jgi:hypothetical protein